MDETRTLRSRRVTRQPSLPRTAHPIGTPRGLSPNTGVLAASAWLADRGIVPDGPKWFVELALIAGARTRLQIDIYAEEWGVQLHHDGCSSWVRVTDVAFVHGRDDFNLVDRMPRLREIALWIRRLENELGVRFDRDEPAIRSSITGADAVVRAWVALL